MHDTIHRDEIRHEDFRFIDEDGAVDDGDLEVFTVEGGDAGAVFEVGAVVCFAGC